MLISGTWRLRYSAIIPSRSALLHTVSRSRFSRLNSSETSTAPATIWSFRWSSNPFISARSAVVDSSSLPTNFCSGSRSITPAW